MARTLKDLKIKAGRVLAGKSSADALPVVSKNYNDLLDYIEILEETVNSIPEIPYVSYVALMNQSGTSAPVPTILENTLGTITWQYGGAGNYYALFVTGQNDNNTVLLSGRVNIYSSGTQLDDIAFITGGVIQLLTSKITIDGTGVVSTTGTNNMLNNFPIEIRVYL